MMVPKEVAAAAVRTLLALSRALSEQIRWCASYLCWVNSNVTKNYKAFFNVLKVVHFPWIPLCEFCVSCCRFVMYRQIMGLWLYRPTRWEGLFIKFHCRYVLVSLTLWAYQKIKPTGFSPSLFGYFCSWLIWRVQTRQMTSCLAYLGNSSPFDLYKKSNTKCSFDSLIVPRLSIKCLFWLFVFEGLDISWK